MTEDARAELASLREEVRELRGKVEALESLARIFGAIPAPDNGGGDLVPAEWDGLRFMVAPGEDPAAKGKALRKIMDKADGKLTFGDAS